MKQKPLTSILKCVLWSAGILTAGTIQAATPDPDSNTASSDFRISGFGTLGVVHSNSDQADFSSSVLQPNGAGKSKSTSFGVDTKAGVQATTRIGKDMTATVQVVADHRADNTYSPRFEWANLKYQIAQETYVRAGRVVAPVFMVSDYRNVGYAQTAVRMPIDVYFVNPITHIDGFEFGTRFDVGGGHLAVQLSGGRQKESTAKPVPGGIAITQPHGFAKMGNLTYEYGPSTFRFGLAKSRNDAKGEFLDQVDQLFAPQAALGGRSVGALLGHPENTIADRHAIKVTLLNLGYAYDAGSWLAQTEYVSSKGGGNMYLDLDAWYVLGGYRLGQFTPYASFSEVKSEVSQGVLRQPRAAVPASLAAVLPADMLAQLNQAAWGINATDASLGLGHRQRTVTLGVRYDFYKNLALKFQYDRIRKPGSLAAPNSGFFVVPFDSTVGGSLLPTFNRSGSTVNLLTLALDFVF